MTTPATVVGAAIVRAGQVLAARRTAPPELAGRWEFPGGKVDLGESDSAALVREIHEELGCTVEVAGWLCGSAPIGERLVLRVAVVHLTAGEPVPREHDAVRWVAADELAGLDWLEPDRPFLAELAGWLGRSAPPAVRHDDRVRGIFFEESHALAVVARLTAEGYDATLVRERLAGEDDDEDHPWAVLTDAPPVTLELLVEQYDGWLDEEDADRGPTQPTLPPLDLPAAPKRIKRP
ncbi:(deoxy)nucleoside triphosphate pyrophosphohydrolase [Nocardioides sp.]|uniref:(deoxy)nucleoside triphosphate pyrophosphohydrolase n=1 Tax=Nocardioides sp. TaxID=35761 RepID=UPI00356326A2